MANHKRHRPKNRRGGCLMCKPWKMNGFGNHHYGYYKFNAQYSNHKREQFANDEAEYDDYWYEYANGEKANDNR